MNKELNRSMVVFDQEHHTYYLNGKLLHGVTPLIKWAYPLTYSDVPEDVLEKAAERGLLIHEQCELADSLGITPTIQEALAYLEIKKQKGLETLTNEYLVSDNKDIASSIDVVFTDCSIADIKCTSSIHIPNVTLQLSIYAYLFELNNKGVKAGKLYVIWLPKAQYGQPKLMELKRIPIVKVKKVIKTYFADGSRDDVADILDAGLPRTMTVGDKLPQQVIDAQSNLIAFETQIKTLKEQEEQLKAGLLELMKQHNVKKWETDKISMTYVKTDDKEIFDYTRYEKEHPDVIKEYSKMKKGSESIRIKIK